MANIEKELRVMHACEKGAAGVYRGHKCVARYFFRNLMSQLDEMRDHEKSHADAFAALLSRRNYRKSFLAPFYFWAGLFYGFFTGLFGQRAIGTSTSTIESIVNEELELSLQQMPHEPDITKVIREVQLDELQHKRRGDELTDNGAGPVFIGKLARMGAYTAKYLAQRS